MAAPGLPDGLDVTISNELNCPRADVVYFLRRAAGK